MNFHDMFKNAREVQSRLADIRANTTATGESGGGLVKATLNGDYEALRVEIDPGAVAAAATVAEDRAMLQDLITAAINDAVRQIAASHQENVGDALRKVRLPPGFKPPW